MKTYRVDLKDEDEGVDLISFVESPAIEVDFIALSKQKEYFSLPDKRIVNTPILIADKPIYRNNNKLGEHYITFDAETISKISQRYFKNGNMFKFNLEHSDDVNGVYMIESYLVNRKRGINPPNEFSDISDGSWIGSFKVENDKLWDAIKLGKFKGVSIEGFLSMQEDTSDIDELDLSDIREIYQELGKLR